MSSTVVPGDADEPNVLHGLVRKRAEIAGKIEEHRRASRQLLDELGHIDAAIRIFDPRLDISRIRAKPAPPPHRAGNGEIMRIVFGVLRSASEPLTSPDLARHVMEARCLDTDDRELTNLMVNRMRPCLRAQRDKGVVRSVLLRSGLLGWVLAEDDGDAPLTREPGVTGHA